MESGYSSHPATPEMSSPAPTETAPMETPATTTTATAAGGKGTKTKIVKKTPGVVVEGKGLDIPATPGADEKKKRKRSQKPSTYGSDICKLQKSMKSTVPQTPRNDTTRSMSCMMQFVADTLTCDAKKNASMAGRTSLLPRDYKLACYNVLGGVLAKQATDAGDLALKNYGEWQAAHPPKTPRVSKAKKMTPQPTAVEAAC